jgi:hypothetical protein
MLHEGIHEEVVQRTRVESVVLFFCRGYNDTLYWKLKYYVQSPQWKKQPLFFCAIDDQMDGRQTECFYWNIHRGGSTFAAPY